MSMQTTVRKWGHSAGAIIPMSIVKKLNISLGDKSEVSILHGGVFIKTKKPEVSLSDLIVKSPLEAVSLEKEDQAWLDS
jgi:antitoxin MazE/antitoxin ChpS